MLLDLLAHIALEEVVRCPAYCLDRGGLHGGRFRTTTEQSNAPADKKRACGLIPLLGARTSRAEISTSYAISPFLTSIMIRFPVASAFVFGPNGSMLIRWSSLSRVIFGLPCGVFLAWLSVYQAGICPFVWYY